MINISFLRELFEMVVDLQAGKKDICLKSDPGACFF